jgi:predicted amidohydrolase
MSKLPTTRPEGLQAKTGYHSGMNRFVAACVQLTSRADVAENLATCARGIGEAARRGAQLVVLPENFAFVGMGETEKLELAETLDAIRPGRILGALLEAADQHGVWVIGGGMPEASPASGKVYNSCVAVSPGGKVAAVYRKIHLFDVQIPGAAEFRESGTVEPGRDVVVVETPFAPVGLTICYDVRFPELYRALAGRGARVVVVPAAFTLHTGKDHWHPLLRARAIENQVYVLAAAQHGRANEKRVCYGHSLIADPWGTVIAEASDRDGVIVGEIDLDFQDKVRRELPCLGHRRL